MTGGRVTACFPGRTDQAGVARRWLGGWLGEGRPAADDAVLLLSETFANACLHSRSALPGGVVEVAVTPHGGLLEIEITDDGGGAAELVPGHAEDDAESGRGL
ncbi:anti-sigma regulatory factor (Ser/Thr protein kinase) [Actinocorallia herbida]|uniref:Anti-sigma regulatory factor (Ser/Thr protein kinase) n=1 Tax=Actinocorallia herbida TaxID=58109 RepID=A0A3N1D880_9ACTN|nr:ATP-binding protein [Actinocorallia herbida]ROO89734.1 anti-sigma regulatory factor (Ser/Thr protein kinase) [Actinocorallia herbida]